jgi:hypothetical protein
MHAIYRTTIVHERFGNYLRVSRAQAAPVSATRIRQGGPDELALLQSLVSIHSPNAADSDADRRGAPVHAQVMPLLAGLGCALGIGTEHTVADTITITARAAAICRSNMYAALSSVIRGIVPEITLPCLSAGDDSA